MVKMPKWFPFVFMLLGLLGVADCFKAEVTRTDIIMTIGVITWAILSIDQKDPNEP